MNYLSFVLLLTFCWVKTVYAIDQPPTNLDFISFTTSGNGCMGGSVVYLLSEDSEAMTLTFSDNLAAAGQGEGRAQRRSCQLRFKVESPSDWKMGVVGVELRGTTFAESEAATFSRIRFQNATGSWRSLGTKRHLGPVDEAIFSSDLVEFANTQWIGCEKSAQFIMDIAIQAESYNGGESYIAIDSIDAEIEQTLALAWKPCQPDQKKRVIGTCNISVGYPEEISPRRDIIVHAQGRTQQKVTRKLQRKIEKRCGKLLERRGLICLEGMEACQMTDL